MRKIKAEVQVEGKVMGGGGFAGRVYVASAPHLVPKSVQWSISTKGLQRKRSCCMSASLDLNLDVL